MEWTTNWRVYGSWLAKTTTRTEREQYPLEKSGYDAQGTYSNKEPQDNGRNVK